GRCSRGRRGRRSIASRAAMTGSRVRADIEAATAALAAAFGFVPFVPRLVRAAFTGRRDRERMLATLRNGLDAAPREPPPVADGRAPRVFLVAGEPSGDAYAADLAAAIRRLAPGARLDGLGGPRMSAAGVNLVGDLVSDPVMGV